MPADTFNAHDAGKIVAYVETGRSLTESAELVGRGRATVNAWLDKGRADADQESEKARFARAYDEAKTRQSVSLSPDDLIRLLEQSAINGSVQATKMLLERPWEKTEEPEAPAKAPSIFDELAAKRAGR